MTKQVKKITQYLNMCTKYHPNVAMLG